MIGKNFYYQEKKMIATVTLNPSLDMILKLNRLKLNQYNIVKRVTRIPGGKGINISKAVRVYGLETMALGFLGGHNSHYIAEQLRQYSITTNFWHIEEETRENVIIIEENNNTHTLLSEPGPEITEHDLDHFKSIFFRVMAQSKVVALSGSLPSKVPDDIYFQLIELAHQRNVLTILDATGTAFDKGLQAKPFLARPDLRATGYRFFNKKIDSQESALEIAQEIIKHGVKIAIVSLGDNKDVIVTEEGAWLAESAADNFVNIVGRDESIIAGFAIKITSEEKEQMADIIQFAMACGLASSLTDSEVFHSRDDITACLPSIKVTELK